MTKKLLALLFGALPVAALATTEVDPAIDTNADGMYSIEEMQAAFPELTDETFLAIDANADGLVDMDEMTVAMEAEVLPTTDG